MAGSNVAPTLRLQFTYTAKPMIVFDGEMGCSYVGVEESAQILADQVCVFVCSRALLASRCDFKVSALPDQVYVCVRVPVRCLRHKPVLPCVYCVCVCVGGRAYVFLRACLRGLLCAHAGFRHAAEPEILFFAV